MTSYQSVIAECTHDEKEKNRRRQSTALFASCGLFMVLFFFTPRANAQGPQIVNCPNPLAGQALLTVPEIKSENGRLKALLVLGDNDKRVLWDSGSTPRCATQFMRFFHGRSLLKSGLKTRFFPRAILFPAPHCGPEWAT